MSLPTELQHWLPAVAGGLTILGLFSCYWLTRHRNVAPKAKTPEPKAKTPEPRVVWDPFTHGSTSERRTSARRRGGVVTVLISQANSPTEPFRGQVVDRSVGGLALYMDHEIPPDAILTLKPIGRGADFPGIEVVVKNCQRSPPGWKVGTRFLQVPSATLLMEFG